MRVKRDSVREAILASAVRHFSSEGFLRATISAIAKDARTAASNVYVYFPSKLDLALTVFEPWLKKEMLKLERAVRREKTAEGKIRRLVDGLLRRIPEDQAGHTTTLVQALSTARPSDRYNPDLLHWTEDKVARILRGALGDVISETESASLSRALMLIFDGVALRRNLSIATVGEDLVDIVTSLVLARSTPFFETGAEGAMSVR